MSNMPLIKDFLNTVPGMLLYLLFSGYRLYALGICFVLALLFRRISGAFALAVTGPLLLFVIGFKFPAGYDPDAVFWAVLIYLLTALGGVLGALLVIPIRHSARDRGVYYYY